jgi:transposase
MSSRGTYRRHSPQFRLQLCQDIRSGAIGRRDAARHHNLSTNLLQLWLTQYDRGELSSEEAEASIIAEYEAWIAALERKVGQLAMELDLAKNAAPAPRARQRDLIDHHRPPACSVRRGCQVIELPRSTYYYWAQESAVTLTDGELVRRQHP